MAVSECGVKFYLYTNGRRLAAEDAGGGARCAVRDRVLRLLIRPLGWLPFRMAGRLGSALGRLAYRLGGREVDNARVNLAMCFPDLSAAAREDLVRRNLVETGRSFAEMIRIWSGRRLRLADWVEDRSFIEAGRALRARGHGVIFALPHVGNWELIGDSIMKISPTTALYRPSRLRFLDDLMRRGRARTGVTPVPIDRQGLRALHAALQRGEGVVILPDQVPKGAGASRVVAPFFGHPAMTMTLISRLARRHRAAVLFCCAVHDAALGRYRIFHFEGAAAIADADPEAAAAALNRGVERFAREFPAHYQWTYRRFQLPGADGPGPYD